MGAILKTSDSMSLGQFRFITSPRSKHPPRTVIQDYFTPYALINSEYRI